MTAEFVFRPISGLYQEKHFGDIDSEPLWVKFTKSNLDEWIGSFDQGWSGYKTTILLLNQNESVFVICGGKGYLIDINNQTLLNNFQINSITTAIVNPNENEVYYSDGTQLKKIDSKCEMFTILNEYFYDELEFIEIKNNILYAKYWYYQKGTEPFFFELNLSTKEIKDSLLD